MMVLMTNYNLIINIFCLLGYKSLYHIRFYNEIHFQCIVSLSGWQKYNIYLRMWTNHLESAFFIKSVHINNGDVNQMMTTASLYFKILKGYV